MDWLAAHALASVLDPSVRPALFDAVIGYDAHDRVALPIACTLDLDDGAERARRWQRFIERTSSSPRRRGRLFEIRFQPGPGVREELETLTAAEARSCTFVDWTIVVDQGQLTLQVAASEDKPGDIEPIVAAFGVAGSHAAS